MLQSEFIRFLTEADADIQAFPVLPVEKAELNTVTGNDHDAKDNSGSPFTFTSQRYRLNKEDELFEDGDIQRHLYLQNAITSVADDTEKPKVSEFRCHIAGCSQLFDTLEGYEHHYNTFHRNVCSYCKRSFPSGHLLDIHILEWHDSLFQILAEKQNMYQCLVEGCCVKFKTSIDRKDHLIKIHSYPPDFRFDKPKKSKSQGKTPHRRDVTMEVSVAFQPCPDDTGNMESMEVCPPEKTQPAMNEDSPGHVEQLKPRYSYKVPDTICFGQGSVRGFRGMKKKK
ncbi:zinc finger protein 511-like isoform X2 [Polyodon spathula]|uniref:zinc finger protein 511-like isoform X2 n=1 Tax=Polyodon spathula TaxID=7913 RepID=UPI001B7E19A4|nr:zinc finger protein 511-like isoform X2 [Polyodon spathula]